MMMSETERPCAWAVKAFFRCCLMLAAGLCSLSAADTLWTQAIGFPGYNASGQQCRETGDGDIFMTGFVLSTDTANPGQKGFLLKTTSAGELLWKVLYDDTVLIWGTSIVKADSNGCFIAGIRGLTGDPGFNSCDGVIIETDPQGAVKRRIVFDQGGWDAADFGISTSDNGMTIVGLTQTGNPISVNGWIFKTDQTGLVQWSKVIGDTNMDVCFDICQTTDDGYIATGFTESRDSVSSCDLWLIRLDSSGEIKWKRAYDDSTGSSSEFGYAVAQTADGGFIAAGFSGDKVSDLFIIRTDSGGAMLWQKKYGNGLNDEATSLVTMPDGGCLVAGKITSAADSTSDLWILRLDSGGDTLWTRTYGRAWNDNAERMTPTSNGCCLIAGSTKLSEDGEQHAWLLKFSPDKAKVGWVPDRRISTRQAQTVRKVCFGKAFPKSRFDTHGPAAKVVALFDARGRAVSRYARNNAAGFYIVRNEPFR
jgi:hypothetical protein